ncbi:MAG: hypothetical protein AAGB24_10065 [Bacteroidota bacterium]
MRIKIMKPVFLKIIVLSLLLIGCNNDDNASPTDDEVGMDDDTIEPMEPVTLKEGFVVIGVADGGSFFAQYFEELPSGTVDITQGTAFQSFGPSAVRDGAMFMSRTDGEPGFVKIVVNEDGAFEEAGIISTASADGGQIGVRDSNFGVFHDLANSNVVNIFNPTTMEVLPTTLDMSNANAITDEDVRYQDFAFRGDTEILTFMRTLTQGTLPKVPFAVIDINAQEVTAIIETEEDNTFSQFVSTTRYFDENGDMYSFHGGGGLTDSAAILRIPAGTNTYDPDYNFQVPLVVNPTLAFTGGAFMTGYDYFENGIGFALVNESIDPEILQILEESGGDLTPEDLARIQELLFISPTGAYVAVNLEAQTTTRIDGLPALSVFDNGGLNFSGNNVLISIANASENALFVHNPTSGTTSKAFDMTGATIFTVIDLSENVQ